MWEEQRRWRSKRTPEIPPINVTYVKRPEWWRVVETGKPTGAEWKQRVRVDGPREPLAEAVAGVEERVAGGVQCCV
jgi:hypothetical protein